MNKKLHCLFQRELYKRCMKMANCGRLCYVAEEDLVVISRFQRSGV